MELMSVLAGDGSFYCCAVVCCCSLLYSVRHRVYGFYIQQKSFKTASNLFLYATLCIATVLQHYTAAVMLQLAVGTRAW